MLPLVLFLSSSLRSLIEKAPITGKEFIPLSGSALTGFRLHPGPVSCTVYSSAGFLLHSFFLLLFSGFLLHCFSIFMKILLAFCCTVFCPPSSTGFPLHLFFLLFLRMSVALFFLLLSFCCIVFPSSSKFLGLSCCAVF